MKRRHLLGSVAALAILPNAGHAGAFPDHPLRFVVPYAPGGATDTSARIAAERLTELLGQQVIVDNRPGGGTIIGTEIVAKAKPDGTRSCWRRARSPPTPPSISSCPTIR
jgi:tripartite-type tricarboxylate transporter receptor subunit TctC